MWPIRSRAAEKDRTLKGRVIVEYLQRHNWNRFVADFAANWRNFNGLYLMTDGDADFYMHYHERDGGSDLYGRIVGFASWGTPAPMSHPVQAEAMLELQAPG
jgi:hypothetical protein